MPCMFTASHTSRGTCYFCSHCCTHSAPRPTHSAPATETWSIPHVAMGLIQILLHSAQLVRLVRLVSLLPDKGEVYAMSARVVAAITRADPLLLTHVGTLSAHATHPDIHVFRCKVVRPRVRSIFQHWSCCRCLPARSASHPQRCAHDVLLAFFVDLEACNRRRLRC